MGRANKPRKCFNQKASDEALGKRETFNQGYFSDSHRQANSLSK